MPSFSVTFIDCQKCKERIHCDSCEQKLESALLRIEGIQSADLSLTAKSVSICSRLEEDVLSDILEDVGLLQTDPLEALL